MSLRAEPIGQGLSQDRLDYYRGDSLNQQIGASRGILSHMSMEYNRKVLPDAGS